MSSNLDALLSVIKNEQKERAEQANDGADSKPLRLTYGPELNNLTGPVTMGNGTWNLSLVNLLSPDIVHRFSTEMGIMYRKVNRPNLISPTPRAVKDLLIKDRYPVSGRND